MALCVGQGMPFFLAGGTISHGWALTEHGQIEEGITQIRQGMTAWRATGAEASWSHWLALLAEAYKNRGQTEEGLSALTEALVAAEKNEERYYEAELYRVKGELMLQSKVLSSKSQIEEAEACFLKAIEIARKQQAKSLELRAVMSLSRLWQQQGKRREEARQMLAEVYGWFTEGFDTPDLLEAKALLIELGDQRPKRRGRQKALKRKV